MVKYYTCQALFKFSWSQVAEAFWLRYPNPHSKHVLTEDVLSREIRGHCLHTKRLLTKTNSIPKWGERFMPGPKQICIVEESVVDPVRKTITTYTRNVGMQKILSVEEKCVYKPSLESSRVTVLERQAWVASSVFGFARAIQAFGMERFKKNAVKSFQGFEMVLARLFPGEAVPESPFYSKEAIKDTARKAANAAKAKARPILPTPGQLP